MLKKSFTEKIIKKHVKQSRKMYLYDYFKNIFFRFDGKSFAKHLENLSVPDEIVGKRTGLFDISTIIYGPGNVLKTI